MEGIATAAALLIGTAILRFNDRRRALPAVVAAMSVALGVVGGDQGRDGDCWAHATAATGPLGRWPSIIIIDAAEACPE